MPMSKRKCGRLFQTEMGLNMAKLKCEGEVEKQRSDATVHSGKTPNDTGPDSHHSSEYVRVSGLTEDPPRARIKFPRGNDRNGWDGLDDDLKRDLKKILKRDDSMKSFTDCIYGKCLERYGLVAEKRSVKPQKSRRQRELELLKGEKKALRRRWKSAKEEEKVGLSVLWEELKERVRNLRRAEGIRQNYERRKAHRRFFSDPYGMGKRCSTLRYQESLKWIGANWRNTSLIRAVTIFVTFHFK